MMQYSHLFLTLLSASFFGATPVFARRQECTLECANEGQCVFEWRTAPHGNDSFLRVMACQCAPGYTGPNCEEVVEDIEDECTLTCQNGGECVFEWMAAPRASDGVMFTSSFMVCECPEGYTGLECEHRFESCPDGKMCFNEAKCVVDEDKDKGEELLTTYKCDCAGAYEHSESAGELCEQTATEYCDYGSAVNRNLFCVNGGKCQRMTLEETNTEHHGCDCPEGFEGNHCERIVSREASSVVADGGGPSPPKVRRNGVSRGVRTFLIVLGGVVCLSGIGAIFFVQGLSSSRSKDSGVNDSNRNDLVLDADGGTLPTLGWAGSQSSLDASDDKEIII